MASTPEKIKLAAKRAIEILNVNKSRLQDRLSKRQAELTHLNAPIPANRRPDLSKVSSAITVVQSEISEIDSVIAHNQAFLN